MHSLQPALLLTVALSVGCAAHRRLINSDTRGVCHVGNSAYVPPSGDPVCISEGFAGYLMCSERLGLARQESETVRALLLQASAPGIGGASAGFAEAARNVAVADANLNCARSRALSICAQVLLLEVADSDDVHSKELKAKAVATMMVPSTCENQAQLATSATTQ